MLEDSSGMKEIAYKERLIKHMKKDFQVKMLVVQAMTLMFTFIQVQEHISVVNRQD